MSQEEIEEGMKKVDSSLDIQVYTIEYLEIKKNRKKIINKTLEKLLSNKNGNKNYQYELTDKIKFKIFKNTIKEHFKYILADCDKPLITSFKDYRGEINSLEAYCDFYDYATQIIDEELENKQLIQINLKNYFQKIKRKLHCSN